MSSLRRHAEALWRDQRAISSVEYAMLLAMIAAGIIAAAEMLSNGVTNEFSDTAGLFDGADGGSGQGGGNTC